MSEKETSFIVGWIRIGTNSIKLKKVGKLADETVSWGTGLIKMSWNGEKKLLINDLNCSPAENAGMEDNYYMCSLLFLKSRTKREMRELLCKRGIFTMFDIQ